jgi:hypothetical protein
MRAAAYQPTFSFGDFTMVKLKAIPRTDTEIRQIALEYSYNRNKNARSARSDKTGAATKISIVYRELKLTHQLSRQEIRRNLTYLISEKWVEEEQVVKSVPLKSGAIIPQSTSYYRITAAGMDKIDGAGEFTMPKFHGINIRATGQSIVTVGDGNQVNARFGSAGKAVAKLRQSIVASSKLTDDDKVDAVADLDAIQSQLAKPNPCIKVVRALWSGVETIATSAGLIVDVREVAKLLSAVYSAGS